MSAPFSPPPLRGGDVHLWSCPLPADAARVAPLAALLSPDERERAARFRFDEHRRRFAAGRGIVRTILGGYCGEAPGALRFEYEALRKPRLAGGAVAFNLSHCDDELLVAVRRGGNVGVDLERVRPIADAVEIASRWFRPDEAERIRSEAEPQRSQLFLRIWTRLEARGKLFGVGLVDDDHEFITDVVVDVSTTAHHFAAVALDARSDATLTATALPPHRTEGLECTGLSLS